MVTGTTPTYILTLPETVDLSQASAVYVSFSDKSGKEIARKTGADLEIDQNVVSVFLTQQETLSFPQGNILIQINWTYSNGKRDCSKIVRDYYSPNLVPEVL